MWGRLAIPLALAALVLSITPSYAGNTYKTIGRATLVSSSPSGATAEVYIRQLANGRSHITVRATNLPPRSQPVWRVRSNDMCLTPGTLVATSPAMTVTTAGTALSVVPDAPRVPVGSGTPAWIAVHLYDSLNGVEMACGRVTDQPHSLGDSAHWW